ncbi:MAG: methionyl-tRNA formyltransferase [Pseudonocardiaceae bacterium]
MRLVLFSTATRAPRYHTLLLQAGHDVVGVVLETPSPAGADNSAGPSTAARVFAPPDLHCEAFQYAISQLRPDVLVLAGFGKILKPPLLRCATLGAVNLHAGKLPEYRGSHCLSWAIINGEPDVTLSVIAVDEGLDTGDVLEETLLAVTDQDDIQSLQQSADQLFPELLLRVLRRYAVGDLGGRKQDPARAAYWWRRELSDSMIRWDTQRADDVDRLVRATRGTGLQAHTFFSDDRVDILATSRCLPIHHGSPGRVYRRSGNRLLICAVDRALWVDEAVLWTTGQPLALLLRVGPHTAETRLGQPSKLVGRLLLAEEGVRDDADPGSF